MVRRLGLSVAAAAVILIVAYNLIDWHHIKVIITTSREETILLAVTFIQLKLLRAGESDLA